MASPLSDYPQDIAAIAASLPGMASGLELAAVASKKFKDSTARYLDIVDSLKTMKAAYATTGGATTTLAAAIGRQEAKLKDAYSAMIKNAAATKSLSSAHKSLEEAVKKNESAYEKFSATVKKTQSELNKWIPMLGGQTITLSKATDALKNYNQSMFDLQRTYQVSGKGSQDFAKALDTVSKTTTLSANKFLEFAKAMNAGWAGIAPGIQAVAALAAAFQDKLGPSQEAVQQGIRATMELMAKFPALGKTTAAAIKALHEGDKGAEKRAEQLKQQLGLQFAIGQISRESYQTQIKLLTNVTSKQKEQIEVNKNLAKVSQSFENTIVNLGRTVEPALKVVTVALEGIMDHIEKMPALIMGAAMAFRFFDAKMLAGAMIGAKSLTAAVTAASSASKAGAAVAGGGAVAAGGAAMTGSAVASAAIAKRTAIETGSKAPVGHTATGPRIGAGRMGVMAGVTSASSEYMRRSQMGDKNAGKAALVTGGIAAIGGWGMAKAGGLGGARLGAMVGGVPGAAIGGAIGAIGGGIIGGVAGHYAGKGMSGKMYPEVKKSKEEAESLKEKVEETVDFATKFAFALDESRKNQKYIKDLAEETLLVYEKETKMRIAAGAVTYDNVDAIFEKQVNAITAAKTAAESYFSMLTSQSGMLGQLDSVGIELSDSLLKALDDVSNESPEIFVKSDSFNKLVEEMQSSSIKINAEISTDTIKRDDPNTSVEERLALEEKIDAALVRQSTILQTINEIGQQRNVLLESQQKYVDTYSQKSTAVYDQEVAMNKAYEDRLIAQKAVTEAGLMGMGPSLEMTQKLVDNQYDLLDMEKNRQVMQQKTTAGALVHLKVNEKLAPLMIQEMNTARNSVEAREIANRLGGSTVGVTGALVKHYMAMENSQTNQYRAQAKIYDMTKNIREGYLDALRAMSVGAGEFETIIGKQDSGISQIMDSAKRVGQGGALNTYAMGGLQDKRLTAMGVGTTPMAMYSAKMGDATLTTQSKEMHELSQQRYAGYDVYSKRHADMIKGGQGETVGGALALTNDGYIDAMHEENLNDPITPQDLEDAVEKGFKKALGSLNIKPMWQKGGGGMPGRHLENRYPNFAPAVGAALLKNSRGAAPADTRPYLRGDNAGSVSAVGDDLDVDAVDKANRRSRRSGSNRNIPEGHVQPYAVPRDVRGQNPGLPTAQSQTDPNLPDYFSRSGQTGQATGSVTASGKPARIPLKDVNVKWGDPNKSQPVTPPVVSPAAAASEAAAKKEEDKSTGAAGVKANAELTAMEEKKKEDEKLESLRKKHEISSKQAEIDEYDDANDRERLFVPEIEGNVITAGDGSQYIEGNVMRGPESMKDFEARKNEAIKQREALEIKRAERAERKVAHKKLTGELQEQEKKAAAATSKSEGFLGESSTGKNVVKRRQEEEKAVSEAKKADEAYATAELEYSAVRADGANPTYLEEKEAKDKMDSAKKVKEEARKKVEQAKAKHKTAVKTHETHLKMVQEENKQAPLNMEQVAKKDEAANAEAVKADEEAKAAVVAQEKAIVDTEAKKTASRSSMKEKLMKEGKSGGKGIDASMANTLMDSFAGAGGDQEKIDALIAQNFDQGIKLDSGTREMLTGFSKEQGGFQTGLSSNQEALAKAKEKAKETGAAVAKTAPVAAGSRAAATSKAKERQILIDNEKNLKLEAEKAELEYSTQLAEYENNQDPNADTIYGELEAYPEEARQKAMKARAAYDEARTPESKAAEAEAAEAAKQQEATAQAKAKADEEFKQSPEGKFIQTFQKSYEHNYKRIEEERKKPGNKRVGSIAAEAREMAMEQTLAEKASVNAEGEVSTTADYSREDAEKYIANEMGRRAEKKTAQQAEDDKKKRPQQEEYYKSYNAQIEEHIKMAGGKEAFASDKVAMKQAQDDARMVARADVKGKHGVDMTEADERAAMQAMRPKPTEEEAAAAKAQAAEKQAVKAKAAAVTAAKAQAAEKQAAKAKAAAVTAAEKKSGKKKAGLGESTRLEDSGSTRLEDSGSTRLEDSGMESQLAGPTKLNRRGVRAASGGSRREARRLAERRDEERATEEESDSQKSKIEKINLSKVQKAQGEGMLGQTGVDTQNAMYGVGGNSDQNNIKVEVEVKLAGEELELVRHAVKNTKAR